MDRTKKFKNNEEGDNPNYAFLAEEFYKWRILVLQGGVRSGKTYSIIDFILWLTQEYTGLVISIVRETLPSLKATVLRDFIERATYFGVWSDSAFNKTELEFKINGNLVEFFSVDNEQKVRGRKRQVLWINEANEIAKDKYLQLSLRTEGFLILDFNPSMAYHYIYTDVMDRKDCAYVITTYKDNPYLPSEIINEIERLEKVDPEAWRVYGEGKRANTRQGVILDYWKKIREIPANLPFWYGLDFGFTNDPTAIIRITWDEKNNRIYLREVVYQKGLLNADIARIIKQDIREEKHIILESEGYIKWTENNRVKDTDGRDEPLEDCKDEDVEFIKDCLIEVYYDIAEQKSGAELRQYGISTYGCFKGKGSVVSQLSFMRYFEIFYIGENIGIEVENYKWKKRKDEAEFNNTPVDAFNHAADASRYGIFTHLTRLGFVVGIPENENNEDE